MIAKSTAIHFSKKPWNALSVSLFGQSESTQVTCLENKGEGKIRLGLHSEVIVFGTLEFCLGGLERKSREATSCGISADWEAGARPALVLKYCSLFGGPKRAKTWRNNSQALKLSS